MTWITKVNGVFFKRLILSYGILTVLLIALSGILVFNKVNDILLGEISQKSRFQLEKIQDQLENSDLERYKAIVLDKALTTIRQDSVQEIQYFLDYGKENNYYRITRLVNDLGTLSTTVPGTENITIYFKKSDFVADQSYFYNQPSNSPNYELLRQIGEVPLHHWFSRVGKKTGTEGKQLLTYINTLPYMSKDEYIKGYMIIDVDISYLSNLLREQRISTDDKIVVLDERGEMLAGSSSVPDNEKAWISKLYQQGEAASQHVEDDTGSKVITYLPVGSSKLGWSYAAIQPTDTLLHSAGTMKREVLLACMIVLLIGLLVSYLFSVQAYLPLRKLLIRLRSSNPLLLPGKLDNEFGVIDNVLQYMDQRVVDLNDRLKEKHLADILNGKTAFSDEMIALPLNRVYTVVSIQMIRGNSGHFIHSLCGTVTGYEFETLAINSQQAAIVLLSKEDQPVDRVGLAAMLTTIRGDFVYIAGIGSAAQTMESVHMSYMEAMEAQKYGFLYEMPCCILTETVQNRDKVVMPDISFDHLENALRSADREGVAAFFGKVRRDWTDQPYKMEAIELALCQMALRYSQVMVDFDIHLPELGSDLLRETKKPTLSETLRFLDQAGSMLIERIEERKLSSHSIIADTLTEYIREHLAEDIGLDHLADMTSYSKQFICRIFREELHTTFSDYLTHLRLERSTELLGDDGMSISEIAEKSGYRSLQYFCTKFKSKYGVTPLQYRNAQQLRLKEAPV